MDCCEENNALLAPKTKHTEGQNPVEETKIRKTFHGHREGSEYQPFNSLRNPKVISPFYATKPKLVNPLTSKV